MGAQNRKLPRVVFAKLQPRFYSGVVNLYVREFLKIPPGQTLRLVVTAALVLAFLWLVIEQVRLSRGLDEFHRQVQYLALGIAFPTALVAIFAIGFFHAEGFLTGADSRDLFIVMILSYAAGWTIAWRRYA